MNISLEDLIKHKKIKFDKVYCFDRNLWIKSYLDSDEWDLVIKLPDRNIYEYYLAIDIKKPLWSLYKKIIGK